MELERIKFTLKSYLRARLAKVERHLLFIVEKDQSELLSQAEKMFAFNLYEARKSHFEQSFFEKIPRKLNIMEEETMNDRYITQPNLEEFVFIRMLITIPKYEYNEDIEVQLLENNVYFMPYSGVKEFLQEGKAELLWISREC